jgi:hypothetical protein
MEIMRFLFTLDEVYGENTITKFDQDIPLQNMGLRSLLFGMLARLVRGRCQWGHTEKDLTAIASYSRHNAIEKRENRNIKIADHTQTSMVGVRLWPEFKAGHFPIQMSATWS